MSVYRGSSSRVKRKAVGGGGGSSSYNPNSKRFKRDVLAAIENENLDLRKVIVSELDVRNDINVDGNVDVEGDVYGRNLEETSDTIGGGDILNGGNTTGSQVIIGTNDNQDVKIQRNGFDRIHLAVNQTVYSGNTLLGTAGSANTYSDAPTRTLGGLAVADNIIALHNIKTENGNLGIGNFVLSNNSSSNYQLNVPAALVDDRFMYHGTGGQLEFKQETVSEYILPGVDTTAATISDVTSRVTDILYDGTDLWVFRNEATNHVARQSSASSFGGTLPITADLGSTGRLAAGPGGSLYSTHGNLLRYNSAGNTGSAFSVFQPAGNGVVGVAYGNGILMVNQDNAIHTTTTVPPSAVNDWTLQLTLDSNCDADNIRFVPWLNASAGGWVASLTTQTTSPDKLAVSNNDATAWTVYDSTVFSDAVGSTSFTEITFSDNLLVIGTDSAAAYWSSDTDHATMTFTKCTYDTASTSGGIRGGAVSTSSGKWVFTTGVANELYESPDGKHLVLFTASIPLCTVAAYNPTYDTFVFGGNDTVSLSYREENGSSFHLRAGLHQAQTSEQQYGFADDLDTYMGLHDSKLELTGSSGIKQSVSATIVQEQDVDRLSMKSRIQFQTMTTEERDALPISARGDTIYNLTKDITQTYDGSTWEDHHNVVRDHTLNLGTGTGPATPGSWLDARTPNGTVNGKHIIWDPGYERFVVAVTGGVHHAYYSNTTTHNDGGTDYPAGTFYFGSDYATIGTGSHQLATNGKSPPNNLIVITKGNSQACSSDGGSTWDVCDNIVSNDTYRGIAYGSVYTGPAVFQDLWVIGGQGGFYTTPNPQSTAWSLSGTFTGICTQMEYAQFLNHGQGGFIGIVIGTNKIMIRNKVGAWVSILNTNDAIDGFTITSAYDCTGITVSEELELIIVSLTAGAIRAIYITDDPNTDSTYPIGVCALSANPTTSFLVSGAAGNGKMLIGTGADDEYYETSGLIDNKVELTLKSDLTAHNEVNGAYSPTLNMFSFSMSGAPSNVDVSYRIEDAVPGPPIGGLDVAAASNDTDYYTFKTEPANYLHSEAGIQLNIHSGEAINMRVDSADCVTVDGNEVVAHQPFRPMIVDDDAERNALPVVGAGSMVWNADTGHLNIYNGTAWTVNNSYNEQGSWEDLVQYMGAGEKKASNPPNELQIGEFTLLEFDEKDQVTMHYHVLHDYKVGSDAFVHVHWSPLRDAVPGDIGTTVVWTINYTIARGHHQGGVNDWATPTTLTLTHTFDGTELEHEHMITESVTGFDLLEADSILTVSAKYDEGSTWGDTVIGMSCDLHYESTQETTISRVPPFN